MEPYPAMSEALLASVRRHKLVFLHRNPTIDVLLDRDEVLSRVRIVGLDELGAGPVESGIVVVDQFERIQRSHDASHLMGVVRDQINRLVDRGVGVCIASRMPRIGFRDAIGSSVLADARPVILDPVTIGAVVQDTDDRTLWGTPTSAFDLTTFVRQLGLDLLACLDFLLFDVQGPRSWSTSLVTPMEVEGLRGSGLFRLGTEPGTLELSVPIKELTLATEAALSSEFGVQPHFADVAVDLVEIERRLRDALRSRARAEFGGQWRGSALWDELRERVEGRASQELLRDVRMAALRNPLEWLTLPELLEVITSAGWADRLGRPAEFWQRFLTEVVPVRNRVSHMRLLRRDDLAKVEYWKVNMRKTIRA